MRSSSFSVVVARCGLLLCLVGTVLLAGAVPASAATGDYSATMPNSGWVKVGTAGAYNTLTMRVATGEGSYPDNASRWWRIGVPDQSVRIAGGRVVGRTATANSAFRLQVRQGTNSGAVRVVADLTTSTTFDRALYGDMTWLEFGMVATSPTTTTLTNANWISVTGLTLNLRDLARPTVAVNAWPDPAQWLGRGCSAFALTAADAGAGLRRIDVVNVTTGATIDAHEVAAGGGMQPGSRTLSRSGCVTGSGQAHGYNSFRVTATDFSGQAHETVLAGRYDLRPPTITTDLPATAAVDDPRPSIVMEALDPDSGVVAASATLDGQPVQLLQESSRYSVQLVSGLSPGRHRLVAYARDAVGNLGTIERVIDVADVRPPQLSILAPGETGPANPVLRATAADEGSAVEPESWAVRVNGRALTVTGTASSLTAELGPLVVGDHVIEVSVRDLHGNTARVTRQYSVVAPDGALGTPMRVGGSSGVFLRHGTLTAIFGSSISVVATASVEGRPLSGQRLVARSDGNVLATAVADTGGEAQLTVAALRSAQILVEAPGTQATSATLVLVVSPKLHLRTAVRSPRRGQVVRLYGTMQPFLPGRKVALEARIGGSWYPLRKSVRVGTGGRFATTVTSAVAGEIAVRVRTTAKGGWGQGLSNVQVLHVRR